MEKQIDRAYLELQQMIREVDSFATTSAMLLNGALKIVGERLNELDAKVKALEDAGHITEEIPEDLNQLELPFKNPVSDCDGTSTKLINIIYPKPELKGEQK